MLMLSWSCSHHLPPQGILNSKCPTQWFAGFLPRLGMVALPCCHCGCLTTLIHIFFSLQFVFRMLNNTGYFIIAQCISFYCRIFNVYLWRKTRRNHSGATCRLGIHSMLPFALGQLIYIINMLYSDGSHFKYSFVIQMERQKNTFIVRQRHENWTVCWEISTTKF